eukprot:5850029-Pyramimonas_sp.AAC.1
MAGSNQGGDHRGGVAGPAGAGPVRRAGAQAGAAPGGGIAFPLRGVGGAGARAAPGHQHGEDLPV